MKILVTGGAGFIGSHIVDCYAQAGHQVVAFDNLSAGSRANLRNSNCELIVGDICDRDLVRETFQRGSFDALNHHAAQLDVRVSVSNPSLDAEQNIVGSLNLIQSAVENGVTKIVFASSGGTVYGEQRTFPADESHPTSPISPYGVAKLSIELYLKYFTHQYGIRHAVLRYTNVYGPRQSSQGEAGVVAIFCDRMLNGIGPTINGSGQQTRDYVFVEDVADANLRVLNYLDENQNATVNICSNSEVSVNDLFDSLNGYFDSKYAEKHAEGLLGEQIRSRCSYDLATSLIGWSPSVSFEDGLKRTLDFFRSVDQ